MSIYSASGGGRLPFKPGRSTPRPPDEPTDRTQLWLGMFLAAPWFILLGGAVVVFVVGRELAWTAYLAHPKAVQVLLPLGLATLVSIPPVPATNKGTKARLWAWVFLACMIVVDIIVAVMIIRES